MKRSWVLAFGRCGSRLRDITTVVLLVASSWGCSRPDARPPPSHYCDVGIEPVHVANGEFRDIYEAREAPDYLERLEEWYERWSVPGASVCPKDPREEPVELFCGYDWSIFDFQLDYARKELGITSPELAPGGSSSR